jgi:hypothetical protein
VPFIDTITGIMRQLATIPATASDATLQAIAGSITHG